MNFKPRILCNLWPVWAWNQEILIFFLTAGFYFWRETNMAIISPVCLKDWISCKLKNPVLSFLFLLCSTCLGPRPDSALRPLVAKTKDNKKLLTLTLAWLTRRLFVMTSVRWSVMPAMSPRVINDLTLHSSSQTRVSASLITARCGDCWSESRGQEPEPAHSRIRERHQPSESELTFVI